MVIEFSTGTELCTAVIDLKIHGGESVCGPLAIGYYPNTDEYWIEQEGVRIQFTDEHFDSVIKQLRRVRKIAVAAQEVGK